MPDIETLQMALIGYRSERQNLTDKISELEHRLGGRKVATVGGAAPARQRRRMSAAAKARIRAAQKKRWAEFRRQKTAGVTANKATPKKRKPVSPEVLNKRLAGLAKARAARAAKRTQRPA